MRTIIYAMLLVLVCALAACSSTAPAASAVSLAEEVKVEGVGSYHNLGPADLHSMLDGKKDFVLVNVHTPYEGEIVKTDALVPFDQIDQNLSKFPTDKSTKIVLYCRSGNMSTTAAERLVRLGYTNVWNLKGGMQAWEKEGLPLATH